MIFFFLLFLSFSCSDSSTETDRLIQIIKEDREDDITKIDLTKINFHLKDKEGKTPLHYAADKRNINILKALFRAGANLMEEDKEGKNILDYAMSDDSKEVLKAIMSAAIEVGIEVGTVLLTRKVKIKGRDEETTLKDLGAERGVNVNDLAQQRGINITF